MVPRWFRSRHRRKTIRFARDPDGSAMVPRWFRPGSAMVPEPPPSEDHTFYEGFGWFRDGSTMVPPGFRDGSGAATVGGPYVLRGIRVVPRWFHDGSARVPRWFRSRRRRRTIRFAGDPGGSAMVPRWFRTGSLPNARVAATLAAHAAAAALPFPRQPTPSSLGGFLRTDFHPKIFYAARIFQKQYQV